MKLYKTTDYDKFKLILGNRELNKTHLTHLENSILARDMLEVNPIIVNENYEIVDGQHRLEVAKKNKLSVYYTMVNSHSSLREVQLLNANLRGWSLQDYLKSYIALGNRDYKILADFIERYDLPIMVSFNLLEGGRTHGNGAREDVHRFKSGKLKIKSLKKSIELAEKLNLVKPYVISGLWKDRDFIRALEIAFSKVGTKRLIKKLSSVGRTIQRQVGMKDYLRTLEDIYNFRLSEDKRTRFF